MGFLKKETRRDLVGAAPAFNRAYLPDVLVVAEAAVVELSP